MADFNDPTVNAFVNEVIRPLADHVVGLRASLDVRLAQYTANVLPKISGLPNADIILDGAREDGRNELTVTQIKLFVAQLEHLRDLYSGTDGTAASQDRTGAQVTGDLSAPMVTPRYPV